LSIRFVSDEERATAIGLHQSVYAIGMFAGPWFSGILAQWIGLRSMFGVTALACFSLGMFIASRLRDKQTPTKQELINQAGPV
jgi:MFS family permease